MYIIVIKQYKTLRKSTLLIYLILRKGGYRLYLACVEEKKNIIFDEE